MQKDQDFFLKTPIHILRTAEKEECVELGDTIVDYLRNKIKSPKTGIIQKMDFLQRLFVIADIHDREDEVNAMRIEIEKLTPLFREATRVRVAQPLAEKSTNVDFTHFGSPLHTQLPKTDQKEKAAPSVEISDQIQNSLSFQC